MIDSSSSTSNSAVPIIRTGNEVLVSDRQGFNRRWSAPNLKNVYIPRSDDEVVYAVNDAVQKGLSPFVVSGRHCYEDFVFSEKTTALIEMTALDGVGQKDDGRYFIEAGCSNWHAYRQLLFRYGVTLPAGSCYSVGAGGHISGGGYGLLSRLHGLTVDWITGVDIVVKPNKNEAARPIHVNNKSTGNEADLFYAIRGAGPGNFGIITRYYFDTLPKAPEWAQIDVCAMPWKDGSNNIIFTKDCLTCWLELWTSLSTSEIFSDSQFGLLKLNHIDAGEIQAVVQTVSNAGESLSKFKARATKQSLEIQNKLPISKRLTMPTRPVIGHPGNLNIPFGLSAQATSGLKGATQVLSFYEALQTLNGSGPNQFGKHKSAYMLQDFTPAMVSAIYRALTQEVKTPSGKLVDMSQSLIQVDTYGGKINTVSPTDTPIPQRSSVTKLQYQTYWAEEEGLTTAELAAAHLKWIRGLYTSVYAENGGFPEFPNTTAPNPVTAGCYYNYPDVDLGTASDGNLQHALRLYFGHNLPRLQAAKSYWNADNYFNGEQSIA